MSHLGQDLRYGGRMLARSPGFSAVAILTLALGIGANTAIFSIVNPMLFEPLPFPHAERMVNIAHVYRGERENGLTGAEVIYLAGQEGAPGKALAAVAAVDFFGDSNLTGAGPAAKVSAMRVTHDFFNVYGVAPALGRGFTAADDNPGAPLTAVLSQGLWRSQFGGSPQALGQAFRMNDLIYTVIGVMPAGFSDFEQGPSGFVPTDLWTAMQPTEASLLPLGPNLDFLGRLRVGITLAQANAELEAEHAAYRQIHPSHSRATWGAASLHDSVVGDTRQPLLLLLGAVGLVLLMACANIANLLLARASGRRREMAIRAAVGANQARLARQLLTESLLLALLGAGVGWLLAWWSVPLLERLTPSDFALPIAAGFNASALVFTMALALVTGVLFGLAPALHSRRLELQSNLKESVASAASPGAGRARGALVVAEVAVAFLLLAGAALLLDSLLRLHQVNPGFDTRGVLTAQTAITGQRQLSDAATTRYTEQVLDQLRRLPGVRAAASITGLPLTRAMNYPIEIPGRPQDEAGGDTEWRAISPGLFATLGMRLHQGRDFNQADTASSAKVAIVSQVLAQHYWPGRSALGQAVFVPDPDGVGKTGTVLQIVGVAADVRENGVDTPPPFTLYVPQAQAPDAINALVNHWFSMGFVIRGQDAGLEPEVRAAFAAADRDQPVFHLMSLDQIKGDSLSRYRFMGRLLGLFAGLALALGGIGIYGVLSYAVAQRTREIGIRMALGASPGHIRAQFVGEGMRLALLGLGLGLLGAVALTRLLSGLLFGVAPNDPAVLALAALTLLVLAWLASLQPAWRATRVDPLGALK